MTDLAIVQNTGLQNYDIAMNGPDLLQDNGLYTAVILSLLLDRVALPGDVLPDPRSTDRRGWWGDAFLPPVNGKPDYIGSRLWLLRRAVQVPATLIAAQSYAYEALSWMLEDGVTGSLVVTASFAGIGVMNLNIVLGQNGCDGQWNVLWNFTAQGAP